MRTLPSLAHLRVDRPTRYLVSIVKILRHYPLLQHNLPSHCNDFLLLQRCPRLGSHVEAHTPRESGPLRLYHFSYDRGALRHPEQDDYQLRYRELTAASEEENRAPINSISMPIALNSQMQSR